MSIGFTGSRSGLASKQALALIALLRGLREAHVIIAHGDCTGSDDHAARIAYALKYRMDVWPGPEGKHAGLWRLLGDQPGVTVHPSMGYRERDWYIVENSDLLVACPSGEEAAQKRSGTWATVRDARKILPRCPTIIVWPDGTVADDRVS